VVSAAEDRLLGELQEELLEQFETQSTGLVEHGALGLIPALVIAGGVEELVTGPGEPLRPPTKMLIGVDIFTDSKSGIDDEPAVIANLFVGIAFNRQVLTKRGQVHFLSN
jgi:hypothetical protein